MRKLLAAWCLAGAAFAQTDLPAFEVASVKSTPKEAMSNPTVLKCENGRLTMRKLGLVGIVTWAFGMNEANVVVPDWAEPRPDMPRYDIDAKAADSVPQEQVRLMLQRLLAERFQFVAHHEMREGVQQVLRVAKGGSKLKAGTVVPGTPTVKVDAANSRMICTGATLEELLFRLQVNGSGRIYDQTALTGRYDFTLDYGKYIDESDPSRQLNALAKARFDAMRELGLQVVEAKIQVDTLVVDHAEKNPTGN
jgi:uncharacterized protein (TIGR03435 family)